MYYVYILKSLKDGRLYTGMTGDLEKRLDEHSIGKNRATKHRRPLILIHSESFSSHEEAARRERYLKTPRGAYEKYQIRQRYESQGELGLSR